MNRLPMAPSFAVERTLGRLGKWLRLMGFDTVMETDFPRGGTPAGWRSGRTFLTRTRSELRVSAGQTPVLVEANDPMEQLAEVVRKTRLCASDARPFGRCLRCNAAVAPIPKDEVRGRVPDYIWETHAAFSRCPKCARIYWPGSHTKRGLEVLRKLWEEEGEKERFKV
jgi:uncharacterized protein with PIN domain